MKQGVSMFETREALFLSPRDLAICQRVFDHVSVTKQIALDMHREELAKRIVLAFRSGLRDEGTLIKVLLDEDGAA